MQLQDKITQMLMPAFRQYTDAHGNVHPVTALYPEMERLLRTYAFAGVMLFAQNTPTNEGTARLIRSIRQANVTLCHTVPEAKPLDQQ